MIDLIRNFRQIKICGFTVTKVITMFDGERDKFPTSTFIFNNNIQIKVNHFMTEEEAIIFMQVEMNREIPLVSTPIEDQSWMGIPVITDKNVPKGEVWVAPNSSLKTRDGVLTNEMLKSKLSPWADIGPSLELMDNAYTEYDNVSVGKNEIVTGWTRSYGGSNWSKFRQPLERKQDTIIADDLKADIKPLNAKTFENLEKYYSKWMTPYGEPEPEPEPIDEDPIKRFSDILNEEK